MQNGTCSIQKHLSVLLVKGSATDNYNNKHKNLQAEETQTIASMNTYRGADGQVAAHRLTYRQESGFTDRHMKDDQAD
jgi:hypothetical protein